MARIDVGRARIACAVAGDGLPVVLVHGAASSAAQWRSLTADLAPHFQVLAPDLHGHGESDAWPGPTPMGLADEAAVIDAVAAIAAEPIHLVGHSYGAAVALHFARTHPQRLLSLTLIEPVAFHLLREAGPACGALLAEIEGVAGAVQRGAAGGAATRGMARFVDFWNGDGVWSCMPVERRAAMERRVGAVAAHFTAVLREMTPSSVYQTIRVPTLVLCGTETPAPSRYLAEMLARIITEARMLRVQGAGHMLPLTHPAEVSRAVVSHLDFCTGTALCVRQLDRGDLPEIERHFLALDTLARRNRFGSALADIAVAAYARRIDPSREILIGAVDGRSGCIVGLAQAHPAAAARRVELAVSVQTAYRRRRLGRRLVRAATALAFERGAEAVEFRFAAGNRAMAGLVQNLGARVDLSLDGVEVHGVARPRTV